MSISTVDIASLAASFGTQAIARVKSPDARALAIATVANARAEKLVRAIDAVDEWRDYTATDKKTQVLLKSHVWPRAKRIAEAVRSADASARDAFRRHAQDDVYAFVLRAHRLSVLLERVNQQSVRIGAFPVSRTDMNCSTSQFIRSASWRRFIFKGGRDVVSDSFTHEDVLQGAFVRALENGDTVNGIPAWGSLFRHVQAERAHLTAIAGAEWRGIRDALIGAKGTERAYPATDDKHVMRKLGTRDRFGRPYGDRDTHAAAMAIETSDFYKHAIDEQVTREAREVAALALSAESFATNLARVLMGRATLEDVSAAIGLNVSTIRDRALSERDSAVSSGIDHSQVDDSNEALREWKTAIRQNNHAARAREVEALKTRALYLANHGATRALVLR